jgi:hypothetical protein
MRAALLPHKEQHSWLSHAQATTSSCYLEPCTLTCMAGSILGTHSRGFFTL